MLLHGCSFKNVIISWILGGLSVTAAFAEPRENKPDRIAIIKADDLRLFTAKWTRFLELSDAMGVKTSVGVIAGSLENAPAEHVARLRAIHASGRVEFWHHGWDHKRWTDEAGRSLREFSGTGYAHQSKHYTQAKAALVAALGTPPVTFGAPFNSMDADTVKVLGEDKDLRLVFAQRKEAAAGRFFAPLILRGEHDGTGKPNFAKFREEYVAKQADLSLLVLQIHPNNFADVHFAEYEKIVRFLLAEGWTFALPREVVSG